MKKAALIPAGRLGKWIVVVVWVLLALAAVPLGTKLNDISTDDPAAFLPASAESSRWARAHEVLSQKTFDVSVIYRRADAPLSDFDKAKVEETRSRLLDRFDVVGAPQPTAYSKDTKAALVALSVPRSSGGNAGDDYDRGQIRFVDDVRQIVGSDAAGLAVKVTGPSAFGADAAKTNESVSAPLLLGTMLAVILVLLFAYRSPVLWMIPLLVVVIVQLIAGAVIYVLTERGVLILDGLSANIVPVLVFGVGTDYALLLLARYREELHREADSHAAMAIALRRSGPTIAAAGGIVVIAMLCLLASDLNSNRTLGVVGALSIGVTAIAALTLLPALLLVVGRRVFWPFIPKHGTPLEKTYRWRALGEWISRHSRPVTIIAVTGLVSVTALGVPLLDTNLRPKDMFRTEPDSVQGNKLVAASFIRGTTDPSLLVVNTRQADAVRQVLAGDSSVSFAVRVKQSEPGPNPDCGPDFDNPSKCMDLNGKTEYVVKFDVDPDSAEGRHAIAELRQKLQEVPDADVALGSGGAERLDLATSAAHDRRVVVPLMLLVSFVILSLLLRAVVAPLVLIATILLSYGASLGVTILVSNYVFGFPAEDPSLPLLSFLFLVAFGIDYTVFLAGRIREEAADKSMRVAVIEGLTATGGVITSAGLVLAAAFAVLATMPMVFLAQLGFAVAFGVLLDTFLIRSVLVPALLMWLDHRAWWPQRPPIPTRHKTRTRSGQRRR